MVSHIHDSDVEQDPRVRALLAAAAAPTEPGPLPGETQAVAAFRAHARPRRSFMPSSLTPVRAAVAAGLGTGLFLAGSVGAAAAGALPGAAQDTARTWLETVGVEVPGADEHAAGHSDQRGRSAEAGPPEDSGETSETDVEPTEAELSEVEPSEAERELPAASEHGQTVSETARETELEGAEKGALVSGTASEGRSSEGRSKAGERPVADQPAADSPEDAATADDGTGRPAETADAGADGRATADEASGGRRDSGGDRIP